MGGRMRAMNEDLLGPEAIADPYTYYGRLREEDPLHWNPLYETWVLTRYDDVVWALRHPEGFSSEIFLRDPRPPLPPILETDQALYAFNTHYLRTGCEFSIAQQRVRMGPSVGQPLPTRAVGRKNACHAL